MRTVILATLLALTANAQEPAPLGIKDWKFIKEMSGPIPNQEGLTAKVYVAQIARGENRVKLIFRIDYPDGAPVSVYRDNVPFGFDVSSISRLVFRFQLDCSSLILKSANEAGEIYQFNGKKYKSKEPPISLPSANVVARYFCEDPAPKPQASGPPVLKKKP